PLPHRVELPPGHAVLDHEHDAGADDAGDDDPEGEILDVFLGDALLLGAPAGQPGAEEQGHDQHGAEAVDGQTDEGKVEEDLLHGCRWPSRWAHPVLGRADTVRIPKTTPAKKATSISRLPDGT